MRLQKEQPTIGILILNRNGRDWLSSIYESIQKQDYWGKKIYLIDNDSDDDSVKFTQQHYPEVAVIRMSQNLGYCMAYNLAMKQAFTDGCDWAIWANNDVKIEAGCLSEMVEVAQSDARIGVAGPAFLSWEKDEPNYYILGNYPEAIPSMENQSKDPMDVEWVEGSFLMVSRRCYESVGPLDPFLFLYWEEADFCRRARFHGWRVVLIPSALARHFGGGAAQSNPQYRCLANYLRARNYFIYKLANPFQNFRKNLGDALHLFLVTIKQSLRIRPGAAIFCTKVFWQVLKDLGPIYQKWTRDRSKQFPPPLLEECKSAKMEIVCQRIPEIL